MDRTPRTPTRLLVSAAAVLAAAVLLALPSVESIEGFHRINARVAIGGQPTPEQVTALANEGFNAIINLREESELNDGAQSHAAVASGVQFFRVPVSKENPSDAAVAKFLAITDDANVYPLFIHCASGNRAAALWMIRRVLRDGWTVTDAEAEATRAGLTHVAMRDFARDYIRRYPPQSGRPGR
ncbi:MAG TPA: protein tyrosine phosphatase family protein [Thermoanaerobaculia bacterium]